MSGIEATGAWKALEAHFSAMSSTHVKDLFAADPARFDKMHLKFEDLVLDYSKNCVTEETMSLLYKLAEEADVMGKAKKMFSGEKSEFLHGFCVMDIR